MPTDLDRAKLIQSLKYRLVRLRHRVAEAEQKARRLRKMLSDADEQAERWTSMSKQVFADLSRVTNGGKAEESEDGE